jgi:hypothetical protein
MVGSSDNKSSISPLIKSRQLSLPTKFNDAAAIVVLVDVTL